MRMPPFSAFDKLSHIWVRLVDTPSARGLITLWYLHRTSIRGSEFPPLSISAF
jgi:hypothetical protein